jgi:hypothetical protein
LKKENSKTYILPISQVGTVAAGVLKAKFGSNYEVGSAAKMLYPASGDKKDDILTLL